jgi:hypothetical protein
MMEDDIEDPVVNISLPKDPAHCTNPGGDPYIALARKSFDLF